MSATVAVDREALRTLLFEVNTLANVELLRAGPEDGGPLSDHIFRLTEAFERTDPRQEFDRRGTEEEQDADASARRRHAEEVVRGAC